MRWSDFRNSVCKRRQPTLFLLGVVLLVCVAGRADGSGELEAMFRSPPDSARPWVFWYWMHGRVSAEGITADLEAMSNAHLGGAYLMPIQGAAEPPEFEPLATQLSPRFWRMVRHAARESQRLGLELGMHACDGFAVAGGPWITPELSMQQLVWTRTEIQEEQVGAVRLPRPESREGFYRDIAVVAFPSAPGAGEDFHDSLSHVSTSDGDPNARRLANGGNEQRYRAEEPCWIQYSFDREFTCRSVTITPDGANYQCQRLAVQASDDGQTFHEVARLRAPRHGWQEEGRAVTHAIPATTSHFIRFSWTPAGSEPGAEDLDAAKWAPVLKVKSIVVSSEAKIPCYRGKSGSVWRAAARGSGEELPREVCVPCESVLDLSKEMDSEGNLLWKPPSGEWTVLRFGHTSTGRRNATGGGGQGLECDKFNPAAVRMQFDRWFGEALRQVEQELGKAASREVLTTFHVDSWECGSQNWTPGFPRQFVRLRGYDPTPYLPCMAGVPVGSADTSERFLRDVRATIADLVSESFYATLSGLTADHGVRFTGECTSPTMTGDGMRHFRHVDSPMGEFWLNSPTHDKPNDMRDAISAAHIYGKRVIQAEAFTQLRIGWDETPASLKVLGDRNLALGANHLVMHVFTHNPWLDRKPGQTLGGVGLYFQRDQPWLGASRGWMDYLSRCHSVLRQGSPVADIAVWTGDDLPSRSMTPERLVGALPGLVGESTIELEQARLANRGQPRREQPKGVRASANIPDPADWLDPLRGYAYDSINSDALLRLAKVENRRIVLPGGASYGLLVLPGHGALAPSGDKMTPEVAEKVARLVEEGATVLACESPIASPGAADRPATDKRVREAVSKMASSRDRYRVGPWKEATLESLGMPPDLQAGSSTLDKLAWTHRAGGDWDAYFVSNQGDAQGDVTLSLRARAKRVELWDPVTGEIRPQRDWRCDTERTVVPISLAPHQSLFVVLRRDDHSASVAHRQPARTIRVEGPWKLSFRSLLDANPEPRQLSALENLSQDGDQATRSFAGEAIYVTSFDGKALDDPASRVWLQATAHPLAEVYLNGDNCGVVWAAPWKVDVSDSLRNGQNRLEIRVPSTWKNRLLTDSNRPDSDRQTWTSAPVQFSDESLAPFGLTGQVQLIVETP